MFPFLVTVTTTGQHKRSTTKMIQIEYIIYYNSDQDRQKLFAHTKWQAVALFKSTASQFQSVP